MSSAIKVSLNQILVGSGATSLNNIVGDSLYVTIFMETGIIGLILYAVYYLSILLSALRKKDSHFILIILCWLLCGLGLSINTSFSLIIFMAMISFQGGILNAKSQKNNDGDSIPGNGWSGTIGCESINSV